MQLNIVTPERQLASMDVASVTLPGMSGDLTVMANHAPLITTLRPGIMVVDGPDGETRFMVSGGFAEISPEGTSVLAETAVPEAELTRGAVEAVLADATAALETMATDEDRAAAALRINDISQLLARMAA